MIIVYFVGDCVLNIYTVSFFGHRAINNFSYIEEQLENVIVELLYNKEYVEFLVGRNGEFDQLVSSTIRRLKKQYRAENCYHTLVLPYDMAIYKNNVSSFESYYDQVDIYESFDKVHFKASILNRNYEMVDRSNLIVFYIEREFGGAYQTFKYAKTKKKDIIKLPLNI